MFGGNSFYLLQVIQTRNLLNVFIEFIKSDKLYIGSSAGSIICGPTLLPYKNWDDITKAPLLKSTDGFKLIDFIIIPHFGREKYLEKHLGIINNYYDKYKMVLLTDEQGIVVIDNEITLINE